LSDTTLNQFISRGTNAQRVAFTPSPATPASGNNPSYIFYETDTGNTYMWDGSAWQKINTGSGGTSGPIPAGLGWDGNDHEEVIVAAQSPFASPQVPGLVPPSGGGTTNFLRADGAWATPTASSSLAFPFVQEYSVATSSNTASFTVTFPQTTAASGNTAFMIVATDGSQTITAPTGWTVDINQVGATYARLMVLHKATASDTSATFTATSTTSFSVIFFEISGSHALDQSSSGSTTNTSIVTPPSFTPSSGAMVFAFAAEVASSTSGSSTGAASVISPLWNTLSVTGSSPQQRLLFGHMSIAAGSGVSIKPPTINNQGQSLFASGGIAYSSFSIL
jgi:hypothetical protein